MVIQASMTSKKRKSSRPIPYPSSTSIEAQLLKSVSRSFIDRHLSAGIPDCVSNGHGSHPHDLVNGYRAQWLPTSEARFGRDSGSKA
jgi:hypothetical protein